MRRACYILDDVRRAPLVFSGRWRRSIDKLVKRGLVECKEVHYRPCVRKGRAYYLFVSITEKGLAAKH